MESPNSNDINNIKINLELLFREYSIQMGVERGETTPQQQLGQGAARSFLARTLGRSSGQVTSELTAYLETSPLDVSLQEGSLNF